MTVALARIDDRMIHGQVTVGWSRHLQPDRILLCNDEVAADPWQARVYASSVPPSLDVAILDRHAAAADLKTATASRRDILLTADPSDMLALVRAGVGLPEINVGGMHYAKGKAELHEYVWLDRDDVAALRALLKSGCHLFAQTVPGARDADIDAEDLDRLEAAL